MVSNSSFIPSSIPRRQISSLAVLPLMNRTNDSDLELVSDGLTEALIRNLSRLPGITVKARSTVIMYKGKDVDPQDIGAALSAQTILIGELSRVNDVLKIQLEVVDCKTRNLVWSGQFAGDESDLVTLQNEIVGEVIENIYPSRTLSEQAPIGGNETKNDQAYREYLRGRYYWNRRTVDDFKIAIIHFQNAIELDPDYALAYSGLSDSYRLLVSFSGMAPEDALPLAKATALKALELNDGLAEAHASLSQVLSIDSGEERELKRAIELDPNYATAIQWYAELLCLEGRFDEARVEIRHAIELDPLSRMMKNIDARISVFAGRYDEAIVIGRKNIDLDPTWGEDHDLLFTAYAANGMYREAVDAYIMAWTLHKVMSPKEARDTKEAFAKGGWEGFLRHCLADLETRSKREYVSPMMIAEFYSRLKQNDNAFQCLDRALRTDPDSIGWLKYWPSFDNFRIDTRYDGLVRRYEHRT
ncbi:MAG: tetratricopeptide repeat protein [Acidobacteriota bacterium]